LHSIKIDDIVTIITRLGKDGEELVDMLRNEISLGNYRPTQFQIDDITDDLASVNLNLYSFMKSLMGGNKGIIDSYLKHNVRLKPFNESRYFADLAGREKILFLPGVQELFEDEGYLLEETVPDYRAIAQKVAELEDDGLLKVYNVNSKGIKLVVALEKSIADYPCISPDKMEKITKRDLYGQPIGFTL